MSEFDRLNERWKIAYRAGFALHGQPIDEKKIEMMARAAALKGDEPPPPPRPRPFPITPKTLGEQTKEALNLTLLQKLRLAPGVGVVKEKVNPLMGNWRTTLLAAIAAALNYALVIVGNGTAVPQNPHDWLMLALSASIVGMGAVMKDSATGSQPGDPPTPARIAGAMAGGETVRQSDVAASAEALRVVEVLAPSRETRP